MKKTLRAGVSCVDISPEKGVELGGYPHFPRHNTGVHDPLYAGCIYLDNGETKLAIITLDLLFFSKKYVAAVRKRISEETSIPAGNIMITCSHTHSGPWASGRLDIESLEKGLQPDEKYIKDLQDKIVGIAVEAYNNTFEAKVGVDKGYCGKEQGIGGNRRDPNGPSDPDVWTIGVQDMEGNWRGCYVKYALHPTLIHEDSTVVTADYPGYIRHYFSMAKPDMVFLFAQGTSGNQSTRYFRKGQSYDEACRIGTTIAVEADRVLNSMKLSSEVELSVKSTEIDIHLRDLPSKEVAEKAVKEAEKKYKEAKDRNASYLEVQNANLVLLGAEDLLGYVLLNERGQKIELRDDEVPAEIQVVAIGDARIVGMPGEIFVEYGLELKSLSPNKKTFVAELSNGCLPGYVYTKEALEEGGYETDTSMLSPETGETLVQTALKLLKEIDKK